MKRALLLLLALSIVVATFTSVPAAARSCPITCLQAQQQCAQTCSEDLCDARFICDTGDPCDSTCTCFRCLP
jgi:hypothetical protein